MLDRILSLNERRLVELVFRHQQIARIDLANATDMTPASVTRLIAGLEELGLFQQSVSKNRVRGQPKRLLSLRTDGFRAIGVYLYTNRVEAVIIDLSGDVLAREVRPLAQIAAGEIVNILIEMSEVLLATTRTSDGSFLGIGLGLPGNFGSFGTHLQAHEAFAGLNGTAIYESLSVNSKWSVFLENDGTAVALGEYLFGNHPDVQTLFLIHIGYGLGGGAVLSGRPYRGVNGNACLPGALFPYGQPRPTLQDLESHLTANALTLAAVEENLSELALRPGPVTEWLDRAADQLSLVVRVASGMFDPSLLVLGGAIPSELARAIADRLNAMAIEGQSRGLSTAPVVASHLGSFSGPVGAASIPFFSHFFPGSTTIGLSPSTA